MTSSSKKQSLLIAAIAALLGVVVGVGGFAFAYARGASYLTDRPDACANCHVMRPQLDGWTKSSHRSVAVCNDCHTPSGLIPKYATKAVNGVLHAYAFTTDRFPQNIRISERNRRVTEAACRKCHAAVVAAIDRPGRQGAIACLLCHPGVGHSEGVALGTVPATSGSILPQRAHP